MRRLERPSQAGGQYADGRGPHAARLFECLPGKPLMSRDNLDSLRRDNVCTGPIAPELHVVPTGLEAVAPSYL